MVADGVSSVGPEGARLVRAQIAKIVTAEPFANSDRVTRFLCHVVDRSLEGRGGDLKESSIGVAVFDREPSYDPKSDPIVRVEARRLRAKLEAYYTGEGQGDPVLITIPKGGYAPDFRFKAAAQQEPVVEPPATPPSDRPAVRRRRAPLWAIALSTVLIAIPVSWPLLFPSSYTHRFWALLFTPKRPTLIVPSDSALVILQNLTNRPVSLADYASGAYRLGLDSRTGIDPKTLFDFGSRQYTLVPHLNFVPEVGRLPEALSAGAKICFARNLQMKDLKDSNVILLGAVQGNPWVELFEKDSNFAIEFDQQNHEHTIRNRSPKAGEPAVYRNPMEDPEHRAFAIVSLTRNLSGNGYILIVEGSTSAGNEAAGDFVLDRYRFEEFLKTVAGPRRTIPRFEALLETTNIGNTSPRAKMVAYRAYP